MVHGLSMVFRVYHQHGLDTVVRKKTWYNRYNHHKSSIQWTIANSDVESPICQEASEIMALGAQQGLTASQAVEGVWCDRWQENGASKRLAKLVNRLPRAECL